MRKIHKFRHTVKGDFENEQEDCSWQVCTQACSKLSISNVLCSCFFDLLQFVFTGLASNFVRTPSVGDSGNPEPEPATLAQDVAKPGSKHALIQKLRSLQEKKKHMDVTYDILKEPEIAKMAYMRLIHAHYYCVH